MVLSVSAISMFNECPVRYRDLQEKCQAHAIVADEDQRSFRLFSIPKIRIHNGLEMQASPYIPSHLGVLFDPYITNVLY